MEKQSSEKRFALLIDADNVSAKYIKPITDELSNYGTVTIKRIYGDWTLSLHAKWKDALLENSLTPIQQFSYTQGKNATDSAMIIDAMDILYTGSVDGFCIVSSDSDFTRLASRLRESGRMVIGMGEKKTPTPFRRACDVFTTLELLLDDANGKRKDRQDGGSGPTIREVEQAVVRIITDNQNNGKATGLGEVGSRLLKRFPDFDVRSYGTNLLSKLLSKFQSVKITKSGSDVSVELADDKDMARKREPQPETAEQQPKKKESQQEASEQQAKRGRRRDDAGHAERSQAQREGAAIKEAGDAAVDADAEAGKAEAADFNDRGLSAAAFEQGEAGEGKVPSHRRKRRGGARRRTRSLEIERDDSQNEVSEAEVADGGALNEPAQAAPEPAEAAATETAGSSESEKRSAIQKAKPAKAKTRKPNADTPKAKPDHPETPAEVDATTRRIVAEAGSTGIEISELATQVRGKHRSFKVRDFGYAQFKTYVSHLGDIEVERIGQEWFARMAD